MWSANETLRALGDSAPLDRYRGEATTNQVFFKIYWSWLAYPAAMVVLATVYLVFEATRTSLLGDVRPWKGDPIVPLSMNLDAQINAVVRTGLAEPRGPGKQLGSREMTIVRGADGLPAGFAMKQD